MSHLSGESAGFAVLPHENIHYRRLNKQRSVFPSSQALMKALYLGTFEIAKKWTMSIQNWGKVRGELEIMYPDRMLHIAKLNGRVCGA